MASSNSNSALFLSLLAAISAFMAAPSSVEAQSIPGSPILPDLPTWPSLINISGTVYCSPSVNVSANATANLPPFANASVILRCANKNLATSTTNASGIFSIVSNDARLIRAIASSVLGGVSKCELIVLQPLATCNVTLPASGNLVSELTPILLNVLPAIGGITNISNPYFQLVNMLS